MNRRLENTLASTLAPWLVRTLAGTVRVKLVDPEHLEAGRNECGHVLFACLHGRMFLPVWLHRKDGATTLVSRSRDGELVARVVHQLGHKTIRGSSHRGAREGMREMVEAGRQGSLAMMVDGPRGPRDDPKMGTIALARLTGLAIVPLVGAANPGWEFGSWDKFQLPKPFSRGYAIYGEPLRVPRSAKGPEEMEQYRLELKRRLVACREKVDRIAAGGETA